MGWVFCNATVGYNHSHLELKLTNLMHCLKLGLIPRKKVKDDVYIFSFNSNLFKNSLVIRSLNGLSNLNNLASLSQRDRLVHHGIYYFWNLFRKQAMAWALKG